MLSRCVCSGSADLSTQNLILPWASTQRISLPSILDSGLHGYRLTWVKPLKPGEEIKSSCLSWDVRSSSNQFFCCFTANKNSNDISSHSLLGIYYILGTMLKKPLTCIFSFLGGQPCQAQQRHVCWGHTVTWHPVTDGSSAQAWSRTRPLNPTRDSSRAFQEVSWAVVVASKVCSSCFLPSLPRGWPQVLSDKHPACATPSQSLLCGNQTIAEALKY